MQRAVLAVAWLEFHMKAPGEWKIRKRAVHVWPLLQLEGSLRPATKAKVAQFLLRRDPPAQWRPSGAELLARLVEMKNEITVRLHRCLSPYSLRPSFQK